jgi:hypothetical protein
MLADDIIQCLREERPYIVSTVPMPEDVKELVDQGLWMDNWTSSIATAYAKKIADFVESRNLLMSLTALAQFNVDQFSHASFHTDASLSARSTALVQSNMADLEVRQNQLPSSVKPYTYARLKRDPTANELAYASKPASVVARQKSVFELLPSFFLFLFLFLFFFLFFFLFCFVGFCVRRERLQ